MSRRPCPSKTTCRTMSSPQKGTAMGHSRLVRPLRRRHRHPPGKSSPQCWTSFRSAKVGLLRRCLGRKRSAGDSGLASLAGPYPWCGPIPKPVRISGHFVHLEKTLKVQQWLDEHPRCSARGRRADVRRGIVLSTLGTESRTTGGGAKRRMEASCVASTFRPKSTPTGLKPRWNTASWRPSCPKPRPPKARRAFSAK